MQVSREMFAGLCDHSHPSTVPKTYTIWIQVCLHYKPDIGTCAGAPRKTPPAQVAVTNMSATGVFALVDGGKSTTSTSYTVSRPSWTQVKERDASTKCSLHL